MIEPLQRVKMRLKSKANPALVKRATMWALENRHDVLGRAQNTTARLAEAYLAGALEERERLRNDLE